MFGPNSGAPWANLTTTFEIQAGYILKHIKHIKNQVRKRGSNYAMMVEAGVQERYNQWIQANMGPLAIRSPNCSNYYTVTFPLTFVLTMTEFERSHFVQLAIPWLLLQMVPSKKTIR